MKIDIVLKKEEAGQPSSRSKEIREDSKEKEEVGKGAKTV